MKYAIAVVTLAAFTGIGFAQQAPAEKPAEKPAVAAPAKKAEHHPAKKHEWKRAEVTIGEIASIDAQKNEIVVKTRKGDKTFSVENVANLTQGAKVRVVVKDGKTIVKEIKEHKGKHEVRKHEMKRHEMKKHEMKKQEKAPEASKAAEAPAAGK